MIRNRQFFVFIVLIFGLSASAFAEEMSLADALRLAAARSLPLERERLAREQAALLAKAAESVYWPTLGFDLAYADERRPGDDGSVDTGTLSYDMAANWKSPVGTDVNLSLTNHRRGTSDPGASLDPEHAARLELGLSQPLLRGLGMGVQLAGLSLARLNHRVAVEDFRARLNLLLRDVEHAYWDLYLSQQDVAVKQRSLERARKQHKDTAENIRRGLLPEHDIYVVEENLVSFERKLIAAEQQQVAARLELAEKLQVKPDQAADLVAAERPDPLALQPAALKDLEREGLMLHPGLGAVQAQLAAARVRLQGEENQRMPGLDLQLGLRLNGVTESVGASWARMGAGADREVFVGMSLLMPLFDRLDDSRVAAARLALRRRMLEQEQVEQSLLFALRKQRRVILHAQASLRLAERVSRLAQRKLSAQQEKYKAGVAALKDLVQFLKELDEAEIEQERELVRLAKAVCDLHLAVGGLHRRWGIEVR